MTNTGPVIPPGDLNRIFTPFERLTGTRAGNGSDEGHGLGISIVAAIAHAHHATITTLVRSEGGMQLQFSFPAIPPNAHRAATPESPSTLEAKLRPPLDPGAGPFLHLKE